MKLGTLIAGQMAINFAYELKLKSGGRAIKLRRVISAINAEVDLFNKIRDDYILATGRNQIGPEDKEFPEFMKRINEAMNEDVDVTLEPLVEMVDLDGVAVSAADVDGLIAIGLLKIEELP